MKRSMSTHLDAYPHSLSSHPWPVPIAPSLNLEVEEKQKLLEIDDLITRAEKIGEELQNRVESLRFLSPFRHPERSSTRRVPIVPENRHSSPKLLLHQHSRLTRFYRR